jgi:hypothetical protein
MRIPSILRAGVFGLGLGAVIGSVVPAFAETIIYQAQPSPPYTVYQQSPRPYTSYQNAWPYSHANTGVYDGPSWDAARDAPNGG